MYKILIIRGEAEMYGDERYPENKIPKISLNKTGNSYK